MPTSRDASDYVDATALTRARREWVYRAENNVMRSERENRRGRAHPDDRYIVLRSHNNNMIIIYRRAIREPFIGRDYLQRRCKSSLGTTVTGDGPRERQNHWRVNCVDEYPPDNDIIVFWSAT